MSVVSTEVQRTLVKSPPELWAELSSAESLTRHLGEVGEIRVVKVEPETRVEWEADQVSGVVELKQSGWGTRVTLSLTQAAPAAEIAEPEQAIELAPEPVAASTEPVESQTAQSAAPGAEALAAEPAPDPRMLEPMTIVEVRPEPEPVAEIAVLEPKAKVGFFARLFKRRAHPRVDATQEPITEPEPSPEPEIQALAKPDPIYTPALPKPAEPEPAVEQPPAERAVDAAQAAAEPAAELAEIEARMQLQSTELLTGVLDRLGAAHHRPFSRA